MNSHVAIICTYERIPAHDDDDHRAFGLNIATSIVASEPLPPDSSVLRHQPPALPWRWSAVKKVAVYNVMNNRRATLGVTPIRADMAVADAAALAAAADAQVKAHEATATADAFGRWSPAASSDDSDNRAKPLRSVTAYLSTLPTPVPEALKLRFVVKVPRDDFDDGRIAIAPVIGDVEPEGGPEESGPFHVWKLGGGYVAYGRPVDVTASWEDAEALLDFDSLWVKAPLRRWMPRDWTVEAEELVASAFDFAQRLVDLLRWWLDVEPAREKLIGALPSLRSSFVDALRDGAGVGLNRLLSGRTPAGEVLDALQVSPKRAVTMMAALRIYDSSVSLPAWRALLADHVPEKSSVFEDTSVPVTIDGIPAELEAMEALQAAVARPETTTALVVDQWRRAFEARYPLSNEKLTTLVGAITLDEASQVVARLPNGLSNGRIEVLSRSATGWLRLSATASESNVEALLVEHIEGGSADVELARATVPGAAHRSIALVWSGDRVGFRVGDTPPTMATVPLRRPIRDATVEVTGDRVTVAPLCWDEWDEGVPPFDPAAYWNQQSRTVLSGRLELLDLRKLALRANATAALQEILHSPSETREAELSARVGTQLVEAMETRFGEDFGRLLELELGGVAAAPKAWLEAFGRHFATSRLRPSAGDGDRGDPAPTETPHPIALHLERVVVDDKLDETRDPMELVSGYGVLMRRRIPRGDAWEDKPWRCLNLARLQLGGGDGGLVHARGLVPIRTPYRDGIRQSVVLYDSASLVAEPPNFVQPPQVRAETTTDGLDAPFLRYTFPRDVDLAKLPPLVFGHHYDAAIFAITTAGAAIPAPLTADHPAWPRASVDSSPPHVQHIHYVRKVPIAEPSPARELRLPPIGDDTFPLARELTIPEPPVCVRPGKPHLSYYDANTSVGTVELGQGAWGLRLTNVAATGAFTVRLVEGEKSSIEITASADGEVSAKVGDRTMALTADDAVDRIELSVGPVQDAVRRLRLIVGTKKTTELVASDSVPRLRHVHAEIVATSVPVYMSPPIVVTPRSETEPSTVPLALLGPGASSRFSFEINAPTTDYLTWERWVAHEDPDGTQRRRSVRKAFMKARNDDEPPRIDDPAVKSLVAELTPVEAPGPTSQVDLPLAISGASGLALARYASRRFRVEPIANPADTRLELVGDEVVVRVGEGEIWELRVYARVDRDDFEPDDDSLARFEPDHGRYARDHDGGLLFSPFRLLIERAAELEIEGPELFAALTATHDDQAIRLAFESADPDVKRRLRRVKAVDVLHQIWRWDGRPLPTEPRPWESTDDQKKDAWDEQAFAERTDNDHVVTKTLLPLPDEFDDYSAELFVDARGEDVRGRYYRFGLRVHSRYAGIYRNPGIYARRSDVKQGWSWKRHYATSTYLDSVPRPRVKLVVPLTRTTGETGLEAPAPLLVVLDDRWFDLAGPEELPLDVEVLTSGPDPILWETTFSEATSVDVEGPVGHTFDRATTEPMFVASSWIVSAKSDQSRLPWSMAKLRFRRRLSADRVSEPSDPYWVQFLPDTRAVGRDGANEEIRFRVDEDQRITLSAPPWSTYSTLAHLRHEPALLVTRRIHDARGRPAETYVAVLEIAEDDGVWRTTEPVPTGLGSQLASIREACIVRIVEVQMRREILGKRRLVDGAPSEGAKVDATYPLTIDRPRDLLALMALDVRTKAGERRPGTLEVAFEGGTHDLRIGEGDTNDISFDELETGVHLTIRAASVGNETKVVLHVAKSGGHSTIELTTIAPPLTGRLELTWTPVQDPCVLSFSAREGEAVDWWRRLEPEDPQRDAEARIVRVSEVLRQYV